jgi:putative transposase
MRKSRFSEEQIIAILKAAEAGQKVTDLCRKQGISEHTFYRWRGKFGGMDVSDARKLRALEDENRRLKTLVADLTLDNQMLKTALLEPPRRSRFASTSTATAGRPGEITTTAFARAGIGGSSGRARRRQLTLLRDYRR